MQIYPIVVTPAGIWMLLSAAQSAKYTATDFDILQLTVLCQILLLSKFEQLLNATDTDIVITVAGIVILSNFLQFRNAQSFYNRYSVRYCDFL